MHGMCLCTHEPWSDAEIRGQLEEDGPFLIPCGSLGQSLGKAGQWTSAFTH